MYFSFIKIKQMNYYDQELFYEKIHKIPKRYKNKQIILFILSIKNKELWLNSFVIRISE